MSNHHLSHKWQLFAAIFCHSGKKLARQLSSSFDVIDPKTDLGLGIKIFRQQVPL